MTIFDSEKCKTLCMQESENGCCYLKDGLGCRWKAGATQKESKRSTAIAITCTLGNTING